eukprot:TRINITY_DN23622_c0_g1_i3.p1 TRINITY_DN23622_c0_g1~~TRINITY_DN23622_c0_g1_i3.p1  ORF type:complete len:185 (-),score=60.03 TRINITY_DN23622_c0_g1_i3:47-601(-)
MIRRPPRSTLSSSSAASDVYKRQDMDNKISEEFRELHKRQYKLKYQTAPDEAYLDELDGKRVDIFSQAMDQENNTMQSEADLMLATESYWLARAKEEQTAEILEAQLELRDLWASLGIAVDHHTQLLNNIYCNVEKAQAYVKEGNENLVDVQQRKSSSNRCRCFVALGLTVIAAAIIVPSVTAT